MNLRDRTRRLEGPFMAFILAGSLAGLTYIAKDYLDGQERTALYQNIMDTRRDERTRGDMRVEEVRKYYEALGLERDGRMAQLTQQNRDLLSLNHDIVALLKEGQTTQNKSLAVAKVAAARAAQASKLADITNKAVSNAVGKEQIPPTTVKKLNDRIKDVNRK